MGHGLPRGQAASFSCVGQQVARHQFFLARIIHTSYESHSVRVQDGWASGSTEQPDSPVLLLLSGRAWIVFSINLQELLEEVGGLGFCLRYVFWAQCVGQVVIVAAFC